MNVLKPGSNWQAALSRDGRKALSNARSTVSSITKRKSRKGKKRKSGLKMKIQIQVTTMTKSMFERGFGELDGKLLGLELEGQWLRWKQTVIVEWWKHDKFPLFLWS